MEILMLIGRIIFALFFVMSGVNHFTKMEKMIGYARSKKLPNPKMAVILTGLLMILGGLGVLLNMYAQLSIILLLLFLVPTTFMMHAFWKVGAESKEMEMTSFMKNMALIGALLMML